MATEVIICNIALSRSGGGRIQSLDDVSREAQECKLHYEASRDAVLRDFDWGFARKRATLALLSESYTEWEYAYALPSDYIIARKIVDETGVVTSVESGFNSDASGYPLTGKVKYEVASNSAGTRPILLTDKEVAELVYTAKITDVNAYDSMFRDALAYKLASELVVSLRGKLEMQGALLSIYERFVSAAQARSGNEDNNKTPDENAYVRSR